MTKSKSVFRGGLSYHLLVWAMLIIPNVFGSTYLLRAGIDTYIFSVVVRNALVLSVVYINFLLLVPRFFRRKQFVLYAVTILLVVAGGVYGTMMLDQHNSMKMGFKPMSREAFYQELIFYVFNMAGYVLTSFLLFSVREKQEQKEALDQVQLEKLGAEIKYLRAQINPHFLFNTLNNLYGLALEKSDKTPEIVLKLSRIMDYMLFESNDVKVYLKDDVDNVHNYIDIERVRQGNNADIRFEVRGEIANQAIVPLMLLPLVENAFKHGVNTIIQGAYMHAVITIRGNELEMDVKNNFKKTPDESQRNGIGLANLERRLEVFYPNAHAMKVESIGDGYHVNLKLRLS